jgi:DNA-binding MurR/RpiR family transcriptional regulator
LRLPAGQRKVVEFFITHYDEAVFQTSSQVARALALSEATVVRTARAVGFKGFREFRLAFRTYFLERQTTVGRVKATTAAHRSEVEIIEDVLAEDLANLDSIRQRLDYKALTRAAELIAEARNVYIVGMRSSYALAWLLNFSLTLMLSNSRLVTLDVADVLEQLERVGPGDVVVGITFERYTRATVEVFGECLKRGARGIALTDKPTSPLVGGAAVVLETRTRLSSFIDSYVGPVALINILVTLIASKRRRRVLRALARRERDWRQHRIYIDLIP